MEKQLQLFDLDSCCGKTCLESSQVEMEKTLERYLKKSSRLFSQTLQLLDLRNGNLLGPSWVMDSQYLGESLMHNTGESPNVERESTLSQILQDTALPKYYLSKKACLGILKRAEYKERILPQQLKEALMIQAELSDEINQDNERYLFENHGKDARYNGPKDVAPTITTTYGTGGNNIPLIKERSYCLASNCINRHHHHGGNGSGYCEELSYTLTTRDAHAVCKISSYQKDEEEVNVGDIDQDKCHVDGHNRKLVRKLTPLECERLQGFPDGWTDINQASDTARYKALGNSIAIPCAEYVMNGIIKEFLKGRRGCD